MLLEGVGIKNESDKFRKLSALINIVNKKLILIVIILVSSWGVFPRLSSAGMQISMDGYNPWPPKGPYCDSFVKCCVKSILKDNSVELFCKYRAAEKNLDCKQATNDLADYMRSKGRKPPLECLETKKPS